MEGARHHLAEIDRFVFRLDVPQQHLHFLDRGHHPFSVTHHSLDESVVGDAMLRFEPAFEQQPGERLIDLVGHG